MKVKMAGLCGIKIEEATNNKAVASLKNRFRVQNRNIIIFFLQIYILYFYLKILVQYMLGNNIFEIHFIYIIFLESSGMALLAESASGIVFGMNGFFIHRSISF